MCSALMSDNPDPPKGEIVISQDTNLAIRKSGLVKRGLELVRELKKRHAAILVVDDEPFFTTLVSRLLIDEGYEVDTACNGMNALEKIIRGKKYNLLLTDIVMPGMSGFELYERAIKIAPYLANKTIITGSFIDSDDRKEFFTKYKLPYIVTPFIPKHLVSEVNSVLNAESKE